MQQHKNRPIATKKEAVSLDTYECPQTDYERKFECRNRCGRTTRPRETPAEKFARVAIYDERKGQPTILATLDKRKFRRPLSFWTRSIQGSASLRGREPKGRLRTRQPLQLGDPMNNFFIEAQKGT